jgi:hypothetical protein
MNRNYFKGIERFVLLKDDLRILSLVLLVFQSLGIRFFDGQGWALSILLIGLNFQSFFRLRKRDLFVLTCSFLVLSVNWVLNLTYGVQGLLFQYSLILSAYLLLISYRDSAPDFERDLFFTVRFFVIHAVVGYCLYLIAPNGYSISIGLNKSWLWVFYVSNSYFAGFVRNTGLFWEPGVYQLIANLLLFFVIRYRKSAFFVFLGALAVVTSFSTLGFILLLVNTIYFLWTRFSLNVHNLVVFSLACFFFLLFVGPFFISNISDKLSSSNTSGLVRLRDAMIGFALIKEKPILGHGKFESREYLVEKEYVNSIESVLFSEEFLGRKGGMAGGLTNGLLALFAWYGLPLGLFLYYCFFKQKLLQGSRLEQTVFVLIPFVSFFSEPITYTAFFLLYPFSLFVFRNDAIKS